MYILVSGCETPTNLATIALYGLPRHILHSVIVHVQCNSQQQSLIQILVAAADAHLLQRCLARLILWKDQLLQHCTDHESAMRQYCLEVDSAMAQQEQKLLGQAANTLQQRDAALSALHQVEEEVQHFKVTVAVGHNSSHSAFTYINSCMLYVTLTW